MKALYAAICEAGLREGENQDRIFCGCRGEQGLFLVADGIGGHSDGAKASSLLKEEIDGWWESINVAGQAELHPYLLDESLRDKLRAANKKLRSETRSGEICGSTALLLRIGNEGDSVISCGDSHCYRVTGSVSGPGVKLESTDDTWENTRTKKQTFGKDKRQTDKHLGKLTRAVGTEKNFTSHLKRLEARTKVLYALCSDGIYRYLKRNELEKELKKAYQAGTDPRGLEETVERIRRKVYENGAPDNMSLILVYVERFL